MIFRLPLWVAIMSINKIRSIYLLVAFSVIIVYYVVGGYAFPDYSNYITLVENGGYLFSPDEYAAEWISRFILRNGFGFFSTSKGSVDFLAVVSQLFFVISIYLLMRNGTKQHQKGWLFFTLLLSPLLLTTVLRATPAYIIVAYLAYYERGLSRRSVFLGLLAVSFHDSAIVMILIYFIVVIFCNVFSGVKLWMLRFSMWCALAVIVFSQYVSYLILVVLSQFDFGVRSVYMQGVESFSIVKKLFIVFVWFVAYTLLYNKSASLKSKVFVTAGVVLVALSFSINEVVGIRFSAYILGSAVVCKGAFLLSGKEKSNYSVLDYFFAFLYFLLMFYDVFRNAKI